MRSTSLYKKSILLLNELNYMSRYVKKIHRRHCSYSSNNICRHFVIQYPSMNIVCWLSWDFVFFSLENVLKKITWILILLNLWVLSSCVAIIGRFAETEIPLNFKNLRKKSRKFPFPFIHLYYTNQLLQWWNKFVYEYDLQSCHFRWK